MWKTNAWWPRGEGGGVSLDWHTFNTDATYPGGVQLLGLVRLFANPWTAAQRASLSFTIPWSLFKLMSIESVMLFNHLILCRPLLLPPSIFPSIRVFSKESVLCISWPKYWSISFNISPSNEYSGLISFRMDWFDLLVHGHLVISITKRLWISPNGDTMHKIDN